MYVLKKDKNVVMRKKNIKEIKDNIDVKQLKKEHQYDIVYDKKNIPMMKKPLKSILKKEGEKSEKKKKVSISVIPQVKMKKIMKQVHKISETEHKMQEKADIKLEIRDIKKRLTELRKKAKYNERKAEEWKKKGNKEKEDYYFNRAVSKRLKEQQFNEKLERLK